MVEESSDEDKIKFDVAGVEEMVMDATGIVINDGSNNRDFRIESNNSTHMLFVDGGNDSVGINNSSPDAPLHVYGEDANATDLATSASNAKVRFRNHSGSSLTSNEGYTGNSWYKQISNGGGTTAYDLSLNPFGGKVSIGTDDPGALLQVHGGSVDYDPSSTGTGLFHVTAGASSNYSGYIGISDSGMSVGHNGGGSRYLRFDTNETERMRIASTGFVGIGESNPSQGKLQIKHDVAPSNGGTNDFSSGINMILVLENTATNGYPRVLLKSGSSSVAGVINFEQSKNFYFGEPTNTGTYYFRGGGIDISGSLSKGSGSFKIDHPLESKKDTHHLVHSFVEAPQADNIYRGKVDLVAGSATINIDTVAGMTEGTFVALNTDVQCFTSNESNWDAVKGSISGNVLTVESENSESTATVSWMVIGERQDQHMLDTNWTDEHGKVILEPLKDTEEIV